jgi:HD-GYP domain-containing protein (c-di-GMP phosphodiesterase class II)
MNTDPVVVDLVETARAAERAGDLDRALATYDRALQLANEAGDEGGAAELLRWMGRVHFDRGRYEHASELYEASLARAQVAGLRGHCASALNNMATAAQMRGRLDVAERLYQRALSIAEEVEDGKLAAGVNQNLGTLAAIRGDADAALRHFESAADMLTELGDVRAAAYAFNNMGMVNVDVNDFGSAALCFASASELAVQARDRRMQGRIEVNRAEMHLRAKNFDGARESCDRAAEIFNQLQSDSGMAEAHKVYGMLFRETTQPHRAHNELAIALKLARLCENPLLEAETESEVARLYLNEGRTRDALRSLNSASRLFTELDARSELQDVERRLERLEDTYHRALQLLEFESVEVTDHYVSGRYQRVADLACKLAGKVGVSGKDLTWLRIGAYLYDVGKASIPAAILNKAGPLDEAEWEMVRRHPVSGADMVADLEFPANVIPLVRNHHEHWDGTGYPDGLRGNEIPMEARILCLADAFDALTSERSFRSALDPAAALKTMEEEAGTVFDPELFRIFRSIVSTRIRAA